MKYNSEKIEAQFAIKRENLPYEVKSDNPKLLTRAIRAFLRLRGYRDVKVSSSKDSVVIEKKK